MMMPGTNPAAKELPLNDCCCVGIAAASGEAVVLATGAAVDDGIAGITVDVMVVVLNEALLLEVGAGCATQLLF